MKPIIAIASVLCCLSTVTGAELLLSRPIEIDQADYDLWGPGGSRSGSKKCMLSNGYVVTAEGISYDLRITVSSQERSVSFELPGNGPFPREKPLACDPVRSRFYVGYQIPGIVYCYDAVAVMEKPLEQAILWQHQIEPWVPYDGGSNRLHMSFLTNLVARDDGLLVEWYERPDGVMNYMFRVFAPDGSVIGTLGGPGIDFLLKADDPGPGWALFQGGGHDPANYLPERIYRLTVGTPTETIRPANRVAENLPASTRRTEPITDLPVGPIVQHMIAIATPPRTARLNTDSDPIINVCPSTKPERAQFYLGNEYDRMIAEDAIQVLRQLALQFDPGHSNIFALDPWFRAEIAPKDPMPALLANFDPSRDEWVADFMQAFAALAGETFAEAASKYSGLTSHPSPVNVDTSPENGVTESAPPRP